MIAYMLLGISSFTYGWSVGVPSVMPRHPLTAIDLLNRTLDFGLGCLQIGDNLPLDQLKDSQRRELKEQLTKYHIRLEVGARGLTEKHLKDYIEVAADYDAPLLRFVTDAGLYEPSVHDIIKITRGALPNLKNAGITLGIENHDRLKTAELSTVLMAIDDPAVGICLDTVNSLGAGDDCQRVVEVLGPFTVNLHIKDYVISRVSHNMGFTITGSPAGKGMLDVPWVLSQLSRFDRCQSAILEQWVTPDETPDKTINREERWAIESIQYLKGLPEFAFNERSN